MCWVFLQYLNKYVLLIQSYLATEDDTELKTGRTLVLFTEELNLQKEKGTGAL